MRAPPNDDDYILDAQFGFVLRQAQQRHAMIFAAHMIEGLTSTQWAAIAKLWECGACSQNLLGRLTAMDGATIKGVIDRLTARGLTTTRADPEDGRRLVVDLTERGMALRSQAVSVAREITEKTLEPLDADERALLIGLLRRLT